MARRCRTRPDRWPREPGLRCRSPYEQANASYCAHIFRTAAYMRESKSTHGASYRTATACIGNRSNKFHLPSTAGQATADGPFPGLAGREGSEADPRQKSTHRVAHEQRQSIVGRAVTCGLDPNTRLKPSGVQWIGDLSEHSDVVRSKQKAGFQEDPGIMAADFRNDGVPLLGIPCLQREVAALEGCNFLDPREVAKRWNHFAVTVDDCLLTSSASTGRVVLATDAVAGSIP